VQQPPHLQQEHEEQEEGKHTQEASPPPQQQQQEPQPPPADLVGLLGEAFPGGPRSVVPGGDPAAAVVLGLHVAMVAAGFRVSLEGRRGRVDELVATQHVLCVFVHQHASCGRCTCSQALLCCNHTSAHLQLEVAASTCVSCIHRMLHSTSLFLPAVNALYR
jgi:hypothetical protein